MEIVGWLGAAGLSLCAVPQAHHCWRLGHARGLSMPFLLMWCGGEVAMSIYVAADHGASAPLMLNYLFNLAMIGVMLRYKLWPRS
jgi:hypothetical protein